MITEHTETSFTIDDTFIDLVQIRARIYLSKESQFIHQGMLWYNGIRYGYHDKNERRIKVAINELKRLGLFV